MSNNRENQSGQCEISYYELLIILKIKSVYAVQYKTVTKLKISFQISLPLEYFWQIYSLIKILSMASL